MLDATNFNSNDQISQLSMQYGKDLHNATYLIENLDNLTLTKICNVVQNGIKKQECGFNDTFLFLARLVDGKKFSQTLEDVTAQCLSKKKKNLLKYNFFKNNLLHSNIWAMKSDIDPIKEKSDKTITQDNRVGDEKSDDVLDDSTTAKEHIIKNDLVRLEEKIDNGLNLFDQIRSNVVEKELIDQKKFIRDSIINESNKNSEAWKKLCQLPIKEFSSSLTIWDKNNIRDRKRKIGKEKNIWNQMVMGKNIAQTTIDNLPFDNVNGFNGIKAYDYNVYLSKLLISAYQIDIPFQQCCKHMFNNLRTKYNIANFYSPAPVKTKQRSIVKTELDYSDSNKYEWPFSSNLLDLVRCSVVFNNVNDLINAIEIFDKMVNENQNDKNKRQSATLQLYCVQKILRIKNSFKTNFGNCNNINDIELKYFDYTDVKFNVLIEYKDIQLIGEIQFLVQFMLDAKKITHSVCGFVRKQDLFEQLTKQTDVFKQRKRICCIFKTK